MITGLSQEGERALLSDAYVRDVRASGPLTQSLLKHLAIQKGVLYQSQEKRVGSGDISARTSSSRTASSYSG